MPKNYFLFYFILTETTRKCEFQRDASGKQNTSKTAVPLNMNFMGFIRTEESETR